MNLRLALTGFVVVATIYGAAGQEPPRDPAAPPPSPGALDAGGRRKPEDDRAALKARLERRLAESKLNQERLERAVKMLDAGEGMDKIRQEASPGFGGRFDRTGREGSAREGQGPRRPREGHQGPPPGPSPDGEAVVDMIKQVNPDLFERIQQARRENPEAADRIIQRVAPHMRELIEERDPEMRRLRIQSMRNGWEIAGATRELADAIRSGAAERERAAAEARVGSLLGAHFETQVKLHEREIAMLEERLVQLRTEMAEQSSGREPFVKEKLGQIVAGINGRIEREKKGEIEPPHRREGAGHERPAAREGQGASAPGRP
jgi:hypothetical protein